MKKIILLSFAVLFIISCASVSEARVLVKGDSVVKIGEDVNMGSDLSLKDIVVIKGNANIKGKVTGDVVAVLGTVHLFPTARVGGDVVAVGGSVVKHEGAAIAGEVVQINAGKGGTDMMSAYAPVVGFVSIGGFLMFKLLVFLGFVGLAMMLVSFMTPQIGKVSSFVEKQWLKSLVWGILGILLIIPVAFLLMITVIGIPLILVEIMVISVAMTIGYVSVTQLIGKRFMKAIRKPNQPMLSEIIWGLVILLLVDLIPVLGPMIKCAVLTIGFGGAIITKLGYRS